MSYNLLSIACVMDNGCHCMVNKENFDVISEFSGELVMREKRHGMAWLLDLNYRRPPTAMRSSKVPEANYASWDQWHHRRGHLGLADVKHLAKVADCVMKKLLMNLQKSEPEHNQCEDC